MLFRMIEVPNSLFMSFHFQIGHPAMIFFLSVKAILSVSVVMLFLTMPSMERRTTRNWWRHTARKP